MSKSSKASTKSDAKVTRKPRKTADDKGPKRSNTAYIYFSNDKRGEIKKENPDADFAEISKLIAKEWKTLSPKDKTPYQKMADEDKLRYQKELVEWKENGGGSKSKVRLGGECGYVVSTSKTGKATFCGKKSSPKSPYCSEHTLETKKSSKGKGKKPSKKEENAESDVSESEEEDEEKTPAKAKGKAKAKKAPAKAKAKKGSVKEESDAESEEEDEEKTPAKAKGKAKKAPTKEKEESDDEEEKPVAKAKAKAKGKAKAKKASTKEKEESDDEEEEEQSEGGTDEEDDLDDEELDD